MITHLIGFLASCIAFIMFVPSALAIYRNRNDVHALQSASIGMNVLLLANAVLWGVYGVLTSAFWVAAPGLVNFPLAVFSIYAIARSRQASKDADRTCPPLWDEDDRIFITAPPGFGSLMKPNSSNIRHGVLFKTDEELQEIRIQYGVGVR